MSRKPVIPSVLPFLLAAALALPLAGCVGAVIGAGATAGTAAMEDRGLGGAVSDTEIRARINALWANADERMWHEVNLQVYEGRVLLTGNVRTPQMRLEAVKLAWQAKGVKDVINEINVGPGGGVTGFAHDTWISSKLKTELLFDSKVSSINYSIETVNGVVYLLGVAQSQAELNRVLDHARSLDYVKKVVSFVRVKQDKPPKS